MSNYTPQAWRMNSYYPESYAKFMAALGIGIDYDDSDFDRYEAEFRADLAAHDAEIRADQIEKDAEVATEWLTRMHRESPAKAFPDALGATIRAQLTPPPHYELFPGTQAALDALTIRKADK